MSNFNFKKKFGQNFLINNTVKEKIVTSLNPTPNDLIIEIGPGSGVITKELKRYKCQIIAFEIDEDTKLFLKAVEDDKTKIIYEDFLKADITKILKEYNYSDLYIVSNLPYYITTPIIERIIDLDINPKSLTLMLQKEVGQRFMAKIHTKEYGYMTVIVNYSFNVEKICTVSRNDFNPKPNVDSVVLKLINKTKTAVDYEKFKSILKESFQFKRKTIQNNLKKYDINELESILNKHKYKLSARPEEIDLGTYIDLANNIKNRGK